MGALRGCKRLLADSITPNSNLKTLNNRRLLADWMRVDTEIEVFAGSEKDVARGVSAKVLEAPLKAQGILLQGVFNVSLSSTM